MPEHGGAATPVQKQVPGQPFGPHNLEDDLIGLQSFQVHATGQGRMQTLCQPLADEQSARQQGVLQVALQRL